MNKLWENISYLVMVFCITSSIFLIGVIVVNYDNINNDNDDNNVVNYDNINNDNNDQYVVSTNTNNRNSNVRKDGKKEENFEVREARAPNLM
ncbi:MAG: hypothetical protein Q8851_00385 [Sweet potato little leaf phytoplasma]|nr:hypothetical protein [Sweet potato little leaf phytoplasma]